MKRIHRLIVTSRAYQRSSDVPQEMSANLAIDKSNRFLWHFNRRRMEAEVLRDSQLSVAGLLDPTHGGPDINNTEASKSRRRSLYFTRHPEGGGVMALTAQFDPPDPTECYRRSETLVPQQALALTNGESTFEAGRAIAVQLRSEIAAKKLSTESSRERFVQRAFEQILNRSPRPAEFDACVRFLAEQARGYRDTTSTDDAERRAAESLARSLFSHHDWITIH
jgi:hypothetical protein